MPKSQFQGKRILIVDDDRMVAENIQSYLEVGGCRVTCAWSRASALKAIQKRTEAFDLAFVDLYISHQTMGQELIIGSTGAVDADKARLKPTLNANRFSGASSAPLGTTFCVFGFHAKICLRGLCTKNPSCTTSLAVP